MHILFEKNFVNAGLFKTTQFVIVLNENKYKTCILGIKFTKAEQDVECCLLYHFTHKMCFYDKNE